jgi:hypothetical protein
MSDTQPAKNLNEKRHRRFAGEGGFSVIELVVVAVVILVGVGLAIYSPSRKVFSAEQQASVISDGLREVSTRALDKRRNFRMELDFSNNRMQLIDENGPGNSDDRMYRWQPLMKDEVVQISGTLPTGVTGNGLPGYNGIQNETDNQGHDGDGDHTSGHNVWKARFRSNGTVVNSAGDTVSGTLYFWPPKVGGDPRIPMDPKLVRAITIFGPGGAVKLWRYNGSQFINR